MIMRTKSVNSSLGQMKQKIWKKQYWENKIMHSFILIKSHVFELPNQILSSSSDFSSLESKFIQNRWTMIILQ